MTETPTKMPEPLTSPEVSLLLTLLDKHMIDGSAGVESRDRAESIYDKFLGAYA